MSCATISKVTQMEYCYLIARMGVVTPQHISILKGIKPNHARQVLNKLRDEYGLLNSVSKYYKGTNTLWFQAFFISDKAVKLLEKAYRVKFKAKEHSGDKPYNLNWIGMHDVFLNDLVCGYHDWAVSQGYPGIEDLNKDMLNGWEARIESIDDSILRPDRLINLSVAGKKYKLLLEYDRGNETIEFLSKKLLAYIEHFKEEYTEEIFIHRNKNLLIPKIVVFCKGEGRAFNAKDAFRSMMFRHKNEFGDLLAVMDIYFSGEKELDWVKPSRPGGPYKPVKHPGKWRNLAGSIYYMASELTDKTYSLFEDPPRREFCRRDFVSLEYRAEYTDSPELYAQLGMLHYEKGYEPKAIECLEYAHRKGFHDDESSRFLGTLIYEVWGIDTAIKFLNRVTSNNDNYTYSYELLCDYLREQAEIDLSLKENQQDLCADNLGIEDDGESRRDFTGLIEITSRSIAEQEEEKAGSEANREVFINYQGELSKEDRPLHPRLQNVGDTAIRLLWLVVISLYVFNFIMLSMGIFHFP